MRGVSEEPLWDVPVHPRGFITFLGSTLADAPLGCIISTMSTVCKLVVPSRDLHCQTMYSATECQWQSLVKARCVSTQLTESPEQFHGLLTSSPGHLRR